MNRLSDAVSHFIESAIVVGEAPLPTHYPSLDELEEFQCGYRYHAITGDDLTSSAPGEWQPSWYVIARNGFDDPFFIDLEDEGKGCPVFYAPHGAGRWSATKVADDIDAFRLLLSELRACHDDSDAARVLLRARTDPENVLWKEVYEGLLADDAPRADEDADDLEETIEWVRGEIVITLVGPQVAKVAHYLRENLGLSLRAALALVKQPEIVVKTGVISRAAIDEAIAKLEHLGATVVFRAERFMTPRRGSCTTHEIDSNRRSISRHRSAHPTPLHSFLVAACSREPEDER